VSDIYDDSARARVERQIDEWLAAMRRHNETIVAIDRGEVDEYRWYLRMRGIEKEFTTIWITLGQRTLRYETYVMPAPEENAVQLYESLLRRNEKLVGAHFSIGIEDAIFLRGELPLSALNEQELDRVVGTLYQTVEQVFQGLLRIGFASRFCRITTAATDQGSRTHQLREPGSGSIGEVEFPTRAAIRLASLA
jgi:hypothetical protein